MKKILIGMAVLFSVLMLTGCSENKEKVIIYSSQEIERDEMLEVRFEKEFPEYDIIIQNLPTGNNAAKIKSEGREIEADIILALDTGYMEGLTDNLAELDNFDMSHYLENVNPKHNKYIIGEKYTASLIVNKDYFEENNLEYPKSYEDLLKEKYNKLLAMPDPKTSGTGYSIYLNVINEKGEKEALKYFEKLSKNIKQYTTSGSVPIKLLKQKEIAMAFGLTYQGVQEINSGNNYKIIELETKTPYSTAATAIIKGKEEKEAVEKVFDYILQDWIPYQASKLVPSKLFKNQKIEVENYPKNFTDANMDHIKDYQKRLELLEMWNY